MTSVSSKRRHKLSRREFIQTTAGLTFALTLTPGCSDGGIGGDGAVENQLVNAYVNIGVDGLITIFSPSAEMGQGTWTSMPLIVAEEMDAEWADVRIKPSPSFGDEYGDPMFGNMVFTSASRSTPAYFDRLRRYGAQARQVLLSNAANQLDVPMSELTTRPSQVCHEGSGRCLSYGEIAIAGQIPDDLPALESVPLKDPKDFRLIGLSVPRRDLPGKVNGSTKFSIDVSLPGMLYAAVSRPPIDGTTIESVDDMEARESPGVVDVLNDGRTVAVVARQYHQALAARKKLNVQWSSAGAQDSYESETAIQKNVDAARDLASNGIAWDKHGDALSVFASADKTFEREYRSDYMYHAQIEPLNAVVSVIDDGQRAEVWAGSQVPGATVYAVAGTLGIPPESVKMHRTMLGGGFGRRAVSTMDFVTDAAWLSKKLKAPVKVVWTREDDFAQGHFRPMSAQLLRVVVDDDGNLPAWHHRVAVEDPIKRFEPQIDKATHGMPIIGMLGSEHITHAGDEAPFAYNLPNRLAEYLAVPTRTRVYAMRGVGAMPNKFAMESFIDELAAFRNSDPLTYRKQLLSRSDRALRVLDTVAEMAGWTPDTKGLGLAYSHYADSPVACMVKVAKAANGKDIVVEDVWLAADVGIVVQPDVVQAQLQGAIVFGLSNALQEEIGVVKGVPTKTNFHEYRVMRMHQTPRIHVNVLPSRETPTGAGEAGSVATPAALGNAIASLTGNRIRHLPFTSGRIAAALET